MDDLLERAKEIIHDLMDCPEQSKEFWARVHQWASDSDLAAHKPQGPLRLRFCKRNGGWEWIIESIDGWDTRELAISDARRFVEKIGAGIEVENE